MLRPRSRLWQQTHLPKKIGIVFSLLLSSSRSFSPTANSIQTAYRNSETDGILELAKSLDPSALKAKDIIGATLEATDGRKGEAASILNAWIASCSCVQDQKVGSRLALDLIKRFEILQAEQGISLDFLSYALAYNALKGISDEAALMITQAAKLSKKAAGGKRRKIMAAARRKEKITSVKDVEKQLRDLCGSEFSVLHETADLFVVNKPSGVSCFHHRTTTAGKIRKRKGTMKAQDVSLEGAFVSCNIQLSTLNPDALGLVHRLDRGSSGCLVFAKNDEMHASLVSEFFLRRTHKMYSTIVSPIPDASIPLEALIETPVNGRPAKSFYKIKEKLGETAALLEFEIYTGRKHQIRVHAAEALQCPIYLDATYGTTADKTDEEQRFLLHARELRIPKYDVNVEAPLPGWWDEIKSQLK